MNLKQTQSIAHLLSSFFYTKSPRSKPIVFLLLDYCIRPKTTNVNPLQTIIVDDHPIFRTGLKYLLSKHSDISKVILADHFNDLERICEIETIDLIIMDIELGDICGAELTQNIKSIFPNIQVLALSNHKEQDYIYKMMDAGATGYLSKDSDIDEILEAIRQVMKGKTYLSSSVSKKLIRPSTKKVKSQGIENKLTLREFEILNFIIRDELSNKEIADRLFISPRTVETHKRNLILKLRVKNTIGLAKLYFENKSSLTENYGIPLV